MWVQSVLWLCGVVQDSVHNVRALFSTRLLSKHPQWLKWLRVTLGKTSDSFFFMGKCERGQNSAFGKNLI